MKCVAAWAVICLFLVVSCSPPVRSTPTQRATAVALATAAPIIATPPPGPTIALQAYMQLVHEGVLVQFARRLSINAELLGSASSRSFDADMLCPGPESGSWQHFDDLTLEASVIVPPPWAEEFHAGLLAALEAAGDSAESYEWFCTTYTSFGQPAEGMWGRLSLQLRACQRRVAALRTEWKEMGGEQMGLVW